MDILAWIVLGILAGAIAKAIYPGYQGGSFLSTMVLGIVGAFLGGSLFSLIRTGTLQITASSLNLPGLLVAIIGSIIAIYLWGWLRRSSNA